MAHLGVAHRLRKLTEGAEAVPRAVREDDESRLDVVRGLQTIAHTMNNPNQSMMPDQPE